MTADEYWHGNPYLVIGYRQAHELDIRRRNEELWLQGKYFFDALMIAFSNLNFDGKKRKVNQYNEKPYDLYGKTEQEKKQEKEQAKQKVIDSLNAWKKAFDAKKGN